MSRKDGERALKYLLGKEIDGKSLKKVTSDSN